MDLDLMARAGSATEVNETRRRILAAARALFFAHGFSRITMDELATELGMSKKTLYQHFSGKEVLLLAVVDDFFATVQAGLDAIMADERLDFPAKLRRFLTFVGGQVGGLHSTAIQDIRRTAPRAWRHIEEQRRVIIHGKFGGLLQAGITSGMVRADLEPQLVVRLVVTAIEHLASPATLAELPVTPTDVFRTVTTTIFEGILTDEARARTQRELPL